MLKRNKPIDHAELETFDVPETARLLKIHPETARDYLRSGRLPGIRLGNRFRIPRWVIDIALEKGVPINPLETQRLFVRQANSSKENKTF
ncbi:MAG: helix-turn-helix domain-containing protein [Verrucomicrobiota bacterium]|jgi:excisionase family DNA binding protein